MSTQRLLCESIQTPLSSCSHRSRTWVSPPQLSSLSMRTFRCKLKPHLKRVSRQRTIQATEKQAPLKVAKKSLITRESSSWLQLESVQTKDLLRKTMASLTPLLWANSQIVTSRLSYLRIKPSILQFVFLTASREWINPQCQTIQSQNICQKSTGPNNPNPNG